MVVVGDKENKEMVLFFWEMLLNQMHVSVDRFDIGSPSERSKNSLKKSLMTISAANTSEFRFICRVFPVFHSL